MTFYKKIVHCQLGKKLDFFIASMMIEHEWFTRAPIKECSKSSFKSEKVNWFLITRSTFINKCRNMTFICMKSGWEIEYIEFL